MRKLGSFWNKSILMLVVALVVMAVLATLWPSCQKNQGTCHADDSRYTQIDQQLRKVRDIDSLGMMASQSHEQNDKLAELLALKYQGRMLCENAQIPEAVMAHERSLELATELADTIEIINALNDLGSDYRRNGDLNIANGYLYNALKLNDRYRDNESDEALAVRSSTLSGIAKIEIELYNFYTADSVLKEALQYDVKLDNNLGLAVNNSDMGRVKHALGDMDSAWYYHRKSMEYNQVAGRKKGEAMCHLHFGELYEDERRFSYALNEYKQAYDQLKEMGDKWFWLNACLSLARVNILLGERDDARQYLIEAEAEATHVGSKEYRARASMIHYELSLLDGNSQDALNHYIKGDQLFDSIYGLEKNDEMRMQRFEYQNGRQVGEMDVLNRDISHLKRMRNMQVLFTLLLVLMLCAIIAALVYAIRVRGRTQRLMRQIEETRSLFFTNVVHQLRTPLTVIMGTIDNLIAGIRDSDDPASAKQREECEMIERHGKNLLVLVDRILEVGSVRSAVKELDWRSGDVVAFIRMVLESYRERCVERHIELTYVPREKSVEVDTVPHYLRTIIGSIIENAINYSRDFSKITVTSRVDARELVIRIADDGIGISKTELPHVFEPFYRGAAAEQLVDGVGIGLTVARDMTMAIGGTVAADSMKDKGSVFTVKLPCKHAEGVKGRIDQMVQPVISVLREPRRIRTEMPSAPEQVDDGRPVALVIEDHKDVALLIGSVLQSQFAVCYASDGEEGLAQALEKTPALIITDVKMPNMDGYEFCRKVRGSSDLCHIPIIILSARTGVEDRIRGIEAGADVYLVKPFDAQELQAWVENLKKRGQMVAATSPTVVAGSLAAEPTLSNDNGLDDREFLLAFARLVEEQSACGAMKLDLDRIALSFKMGESQLKRKIQDLTGKNVVAYIAHLRMEKAMRMLQTRPDLLIGDIADQCGYADVAYFSRVFRQHYGMTPTQARASVS